MITLIKFLIGIIIILVLLGIGRTLQLELSSQQTIFSRGNVQTSLPDGFYNGTVPGHVFLWKGKKFDAKNSKGINVFGEAKTEKYPFTTSVNIGVHDSGIKVIKIDYNLPENPFWLRPLLDEIVEVSPGQFIGKLHVRIIPYYPFTLSYFELKK